MTGHELGRDVVREITESLGDLSGREVCRRLVAAARALSDGDDTEAAQHAEVARRRGARLAVVREATGVVAYRTGDFATALRDLVTARRIGGSAGSTPLIADCERALGRPERAVQTAASAAVADLDAADRVELLIVAAGARADLGQYDAAVTTLRTPYLEEANSAPWQERLWSAYASALEAAGRPADAETWRQRAERHPAHVPADSSLGVDVPAGAAGAPGSGGAGDDGIASEDVVLDVLDLDPADDARGRTGSVRDR